MKKSELKFKVYTGTMERNRAIREAADSSHVINDTTVVYAVDGNICGYVTPSRGLESLPEVTLPQALDLIAQVDPETDGEFVDFEVDANGMFVVTWKDGGRQKTYWPNVADVEHNSKLELIFAGWVWEDKRGRWVSINRRGFDCDSDATYAASCWTKPAQPVAVRFWKNRR